MVNETMEYELADAKGRPGVRHPSEKSYALVARSRGALVKLEEFPSYDDALTAWAAATEMLDGYKPLVDEYVVRSLDDPAIVDRFAAKVNDYYRYAYVHAALREAHRKEVGETARAILGAAPEGSTLAKLSREIRDSLRARGIKADGYEIERAVKSRTILGRCHSHGRTKRAFWVKKSDGPLYRLTCPDCGHRLAQTTLALNADFHRLKPKEAVR